MSISVRSITYEESLTMPEAVYEEIVNGELRAMPPPSLKHQELIHVLADTLNRQTDRRTVLILQNYGQGIRIKPRFTYRAPDL